MAKTEVDTVKSSDLRQAIHQKYLESSSSNTDDASLQIAQRLLNAESPDDLLADPSSQVLAARDYLKTPFMLHSVDFRQGDYDEQGTGIKGAYALLDVTFFDNPEEHRIITCGGENVLAAAWKLQDMGWLPRAVKIIEGKKTAAGYYPLWLTKVTDAEVIEADKGEQPF